MDVRLRTVMAAVVQSIVSVVQEYVIDAADDEDSSDDDYHQPVPKKRKRTSAQMSEKRIQSFVELTIPKFSDTEFQSHFRLSTAAFEWLLFKIGPKLTTNGLGRRTTCPRKQLLSVLWIFATPDSFRSVGFKFNMSKGTLHACFLRVLYALNCLSPTVIVWPKAEKRKIISENFVKMGGFSGVVGAVDGTYVKIKAPSEDPIVYINRKCFHGITLQAICDHNREFINAFAGYPSSVSDTRIFRNSDVYKNIIADPDSYFSTNEYIIGDKAYEPKSFCVPPYREGRNFCEWQRNFNYQHARTRQVIERSFALLFGRFRRFKDLDMSRTDLIPAAIIAACVLHNVCLRQSRDVLRSQFEAEGISFLRERLLVDPDREQLSNLVNPTNEEGRDFRDQVARDCGFLTEQQELDALLDEE